MKNKTLAAANLLMFVLAPSTAFAQTAEQPSVLAGIAPFALLFVLFYFLIIRPQQKRSRERKEMLQSLKRGDSVLTNGGIYATITDIDSAGDTATLEIAKGITVKASVSAVASKTEKKAAGG